MEWQMIENAPKDGTSVLLYWPGRRSIRTGSWMRPSPEYVHHWCMDDKWTPGEDPTHWMPLPSPPDLTPATGDPRGA